MFTKFKLKWYQKKLRQLPKEKKIQQIKEQLAQAVPKKERKITTSKLLLWSLFFVLLGIILFTGYITISMMNIVLLSGGTLMWDFTPVVALITAIAGEVILILGYFIKSTKENSKGGIVYQNMMNEFEFMRQNYDNEQDNDDGTVG